MSKNTVEPVNKTDQITAEPYLDRSKYVTQYVHGIATKMSRGASRLFLKLFGVGVIEWRILSIVALEEDVTATTISQAIALDKAAVSRSLRLLQTGGYVITRPKFDGTRNRIVELTTEGVKLHEQLLPIALDREESLLRGLSESERAELIRMLKILFANAVALDDGR